MLYELTKPKLTTVVFTVHLDITIHNGFEQLTITNGLMMPLSMMLQTIVCLHWMIMKKCLIDNHYKEEIKEIK